MSLGFNWKSPFCKTETHPKQKVKEADMGEEISFQNKAGSAWRDQSRVLWHQDKTQRD